MSHYHLYAIGNALVDSEYEVSAELLQAMGVEKRHMTLIDSARRSALLQHVSGCTPRRTGGGSAGNTVVALSQLGGKGFYSCRVGDDELGHFYADDLLRNGVLSNLMHTKAPHAQTGSCMVFVTPDAERSMCTFLGTTADLDASALHPKDLVKARIYYIEGYLAASPTGLDAALQGKRIAQAAGVAVAATLSDVSMIRFCRPGLAAILEGRLDYVFCNEEEARTWCGSEDLASIEAQMRQLARTVCITRSARGCLILEPGARVEVPVNPVKAVDTNGAGDMFAGAFLYAVTHGYSHEQAAMLGNRCAAQVVSQHGNRLTSLQLQTLKAAFESELRQVA